MKAYIVIYYLIRFQNTGYYRQWENALIFTNYDMLDVDYRAAGSWKIGSKVVETHPWYFEFGITITE